MFAQAAGKVSAAAPAAPCWNTLQSRYSDDATNHSDDDESPVEDLYYSCQQSQQDHGQHGEESEDEDDALEAAVWAAIHDGSFQMLRSCLCAWMFVYGSWGPWRESRSGTPRAVQLDPGNEMQHFAFYFRYGWFISSVLAAHLLTKT